MNRFGIMTGIILLLILIGFLSSSYVYGQQKKNTISESEVKSGINPSFHAFSITEGIKIDGKLDDPAYQQAVPQQLKFEIFPGENTLAENQTQVWILYDKTHIYFGFRCLDKRPDKIRANLTERDKLSEDDHIVIYIDTYGDHEKAYGFMVNPFGIQGDSLVTRTSTDMDFNMVWQSAALRNERGWTAEIAIPFSSLKFPPKKIQEWALNLFRILPRESRIEYSWTRIDRSIQGKLVQSGSISDLIGVKSKGNFKLLPYILLQQEGNLRDNNQPDSGLDFGPVKARIGAGFSYAPNSDMSLDAVINPDFSQIESDASQISVNSNFSLYYPEKRPFFRKGLELLRTPMYYTRSINDPSYAGRIIGKSGKFSYHWLTANDRNTIFIIPGSEESDTVPTSIDSFVNIGAFRYDLGNEAQVTAMIMTRNFEGGHNYLVGLNWNYKFWKNWFFQGEGFLTHTKELNDPDTFVSSRILGDTEYDAGLNGEEYWGQGIHLVLNHAGRNLSLVAVYNDFSPTYQTYNGFFTQTDIKQWYLSSAYTVFLTKSFIDKIVVSLSGASVHNHQGQMKNQDLNGEITVQFKGQSRLTIHHNLLNREHFRSFLFEDYHYSTVRFSTRPYKFLSFHLYSRFGKFIYRDTIPKIGKGHNWDMLIKLQLSTKAELSFSYTKAYLEDLVSRDAYYDGYIWRAMGKYQFNSKIFLRAIVDYDAFSDTLNIYPLFSYKTGPYTTFFAGVTNTYMDYGQQFGSINVNRQYFIKMQYLIK